MKALTTFLMTCAVLGTMSAAALAGGENGGAKDDGTITVENDYDGQIMAVAVGNSSISSVSDFLAQGAQFIQPGDSYSFSAAAGSQTVTALFIQDASPFTVTGPVQTTVDVEKNEEVNITGTNTGDLEVD